MTDREELERRVAEALLYDEYPQTPGPFGWRAYLGAARAVLDVVEPLIYEQAYRQGYEDRAHERDYDPGASRG